MKLTIQDLFRLMMPGWQNVPDDKKRQAIQLASDFGKTCATHAGVCKAPDCPIHLAMEGTGEYSTPKKFAHFVAIVAEQNAGIPLMVTGDPSKALAFSNLYKSDLIISGLAGDPRYLAFEADYNRTALLTYLNKVDPEEEPKPEEETTEQEAQARVVTATIKHEDVMTKEQVGKCVMCGADAEGHLMCAACRKSMQ